MARRIDSTGLNLSVIKLNGRLDIRFTTDETYTAQYSLQGTDTEDTMQMEYARESAAGQPIISLGLEMYLEGVDGLLEVQFEGLVGSTLAIEYDGRELREVPLVDEPLPGDIPAEEVVVAGFIARKLTGGARMQTLDQGARNAKTQTIPANVTDQGVQTKPKRMVSIGIQAPATITPIQQDSQLFSDFVDLTEQAVLPKTIEEEPRSSSPEKHDVALTFANAVETVFQTFNEPRNPYGLKRQAEPAADYRVYKHIFIEGYRNGDGKDEEGRLHVDLVHHVLLWESYDDYEGGARLTLDRLDLPRCEVAHNRLKASHYFGDHQLRLYQKRPRLNIFCMDFKGKEAKIYGNNAGHGDERFHFVGAERVQVVVDAIQECLDFKTKYVLPRVKREDA